MNGRELLELAAKAAGHVVDPEISNDEWLYINPDANGDQEPWNPLNDDGDAVRLAVKLDLFTNPRFFHERNVLMSTKNIPKLEATRIAIVLAAAEIGKTK